MNLRSTATLLILITLVVIAIGGGYLLGSALRSVSRPAAPPPSTVPAPAAPTLIAPANGAEFVDSDLTLTWSWLPGLGERQRYALRVWAEGHAHQEIWTVEEHIAIGSVIDSFSVAVGRYFWQVALVNVNAGGAFESMASDWSEGFELQRVRRLSIPARAEAEMSQTARHFYEMNLNATDTILAVHRFIHANSIYDDQQRYQADYSDAIDLMFRHAQGISPEQPHLQSDGRSTAMLTILQELGIESRLVFLYKDSPGYVAQHTMLEVFNPDEQRWQVHDLNYYFAEAETLQPAAAERILFGARSSLLGCPIDGGGCTAEIIQPALEYFEALRYGYTFDLWVNPDRFDLSARFQQGQNLAEFIGGGYPQRVALRMDNWNRTAADA